MLVIKTKAAWQLSLRRRPEALTPNDRIFIKEQKMIMSWLLLKRKKLILEDDLSTNADSILRLSRQVNDIYFNLHAQLTIERVVFRNEHKNRTVASFSSEWIYSNTRFHSAADLLRLLSALRLPERIVLDNGSVTSGEEALLVTLYRLSFPRRLSDIEETFGRDYSHWSRVIKYTMQWIIKNWWYLLSDNTEYWTDQIPSFYEAITAKIVELGFDFPLRLLGFDSEQRTYRVFAFIDNTIIKTCRPGGSAARRGPNAPRYHRLVQQAFYTGWKKVHGVKFQTVSLPNGMLYHVYGPVSCRRGDMFTLPHSQIQNKLKDVMASSFEVKYHVYGDSAYSRNDEITGHIEGSSLTDRQKMENKCFNACRESIEWGNKEIKNFFKTSVYDTGLRLKAMEVAAILQCCIFFTNCLCAMYGNQTSEYFGYSRDIFDDWTSRGPREV